ncbi:MAG: alanyl-tRNA editing protein [Spirochaetales bacterium]|uniref:Alanine--tRNA ligase n=1 Tax=Candidatus Thalassospirochaeta sargassi TaxID=3119039 RepID=A0AAJ1MHK5_9SPIO|nr:alanyl-tRNA editing protein [Spirochaetales bacterium]
MVKILYYEQPDLLEFEAEVVSSAEKNGKFEIILNQTAFYPEGGGQPADRGMINNLQVNDVRKRNGEIYHIISGPLDKAWMPAAGEHVRCSIDFDHRFDYMQQHTGQHIISAALMKTAGIETVSVHQGEEYTAVETSAENIDAETIRAIENEANAAVRANAAVVPEWTDAEGLKNYNLRRPSKHSTDIRIVNIAGIDCVACGGMHLKNTAEAGLIKYTHQEKIRGRVRTFWKIGRRAYDDYDLKTKIINDLNEMYSARTFEVPEKAKAALQNYNDLKYSYGKLEEDYAGLFASVLVSEASNKSAAKNPATVIHVFEDKSRGFIASLLKTLTKRNDCGCSFILNKQGGSLTWAVAATDCTSFDFNVFKTDFLPLIDGKGGGREPLWQGVAKNPGGLEAFIAKLYATWI